VCLLTQCWLLRAKDGRVFDKDISNCSVFPWSLAKLFIFSFSVSRLMKEMFGCMFCCVFSVLSCLIPTQLFLTHRHTFLSYLPLLSTTRSLPLLQHTLAASWPPWARERESVTRERLRMLSYKSPISAINKK